MAINTKITKYIFSGITASFSNFVILYFLVQILHVWYLASAAVSFCCGVMVSYFLHKFVTFNNYSTEGIIFQFSSFLIFNLVMLGLNLLLIYLFVDIFGIWYFLSQIIITVGMAFINFIFFNRVIFKTIP